MQKPFSQGLNIRNSVLFMASDNRKNFSIHINASLYLQMEATTYNATHKNVDCISSFSYCIQLSKRFYKKKT